MIELLSSATFIVWFTIIALVTMTILLEVNEEGFASGAFSLLLALLGWNYAHEIWSFLTTNISTTIYFSLGYIILGVGWSFLKWNEKVKDIFNKFKTIKVEFTKKNGEITDKNMVDFNRKLDNKFTNSKNQSINIYDDYTFEKIAYKITPIGLENKGLIVSWISYWPLSLVGTLLNNPLRRLFGLIYESVSGLYDKISEKHQKDAFNGLN